MWWAVVKVVLLWAGESGEYFGQQVLNFSKKEDDSDSLHTKRIILNFHARHWETHWNVY
jgi:hypothetical protein